jgi:MFS family permease
MGVGASGVGFAFLAIARSSGVSAIGMTISGVGGALSFVPALSLSHSVAPPRRQGIAAGIAGSGLGLGVVVSRLAAAVWGAERSASGWRGVWATEAVLSALVLVAVLLVTRRGPEPRGLLSAPSGWVQAISRLGTVRLLTFCYFCFGIAYSIYSSFAVTAWRGGGNIPLGTAEDDLAAAGVALAIGGVGFGWFWDRLSSRIPIICCGYLAMALSTFQVASGSTGVWPFLSALGFGLVGSGVPSLLATKAGQEAKHLAPSSGSGVVAFGIVTVGFGAGALVGPAVGGLLAGGRDTFVVAFLVACSLSLAGAFTLAGGYYFLRLRPSPT